MTGLVALPSPTVRVGGEDVPIATGTAANVVADSADRSTAEGRLSMLLSWYGDGDSLPGPVAADPSGALAAGISWSRAAMGCMDYGTAAPGAARAPRRQGPTFDWGADAAIIAADFLRFYRIDLWEDDPHWYRFCALLLALVRTEGSLVGQAAYARSPHEGARGEEKRRLRRLAEAWALPPTEPELAEMARARF